MRRVFLPFAVALVFAPCAAWPQGDPLGPEFRVNTYTTGNQLTPSVAADASGNFVVVWTSYDGQDGSAAGIFGQRHASSGAPLGPEFPVNSFTTNVQSRPHVAADAAGSFVAVWTSYTQDGSIAGVFGQRFASSGTPLGPEFRVNTYTTSGQDESSVASDASGNFVVVWHSYPFQDGSYGAVFGQRFASSGAPLGSEFRVNTYTTGTQAYPSVAADASGNFVVVWNSYTGDGSGGGVFGQRYTSDGAPSGPEFRVNTFTTADQRRPSVASEAAGNFVVAWTGGGQDGSSYGVFGQRYASSGTPLGPEFQVNTYTTSFQQIPSVAADSSGNFVVVWQSYPDQDGSGYGAFGQRYASSGTPLGPEFQINTYTTLSQISPSVAADPSGNFVVVWQSFDNDGSTYGIAGQRYGPILPVELLRFSVE